MQVSIVILFASALFCGWSSKGVVGFNVREEEGTSTLPTLDADVDLTESEIQVNDEEQFWWMSKDYQPIPSNTPLRWTNPCGARVTNQNESFVPKPYNRDQIISMVTVLVQVLKDAKKSFDEFKERYSNETFGREVSEHQKEWEGFKYDWLPNVPKRLGIPTDVNHLDTIQFNEFLRKSYRWLQEVDVGLEQSLYDWQLENNSTGTSGFLTLFEDIWNTNNQVLCRMWDFANKRLLQLMPDVGRDIMGNEFRNIAPFGQRSLRDWIIFSTYMTLIEYLIDVFEFYLNSRKEDLWAGTQN